MCSNFLSPDFYEIFDNENNDLNNGLLSDDPLLWGNDLLNDFNFDHLHDEHLFENHNENIKNKAMDFDLLDFSHLLKNSSESKHVKQEPTHSESSTYLTDESSHPSSINSSPVSNKVRKIDHTAFDSSSEKSFALRDEISGPPSKTRKVEFVNTSLPNKIYKLTKDIKSEPIYINSVTIRQGNSTRPYVVHKLPKGIRTVNIRPQKYVAERQAEPVINSFNRPSQQTVMEQDKDSIAEELYDSKVDHYNDYKSRTNGYCHQVSYSSISQSHANKTLFQPIPQTGPLHLTEEEKRTWLAEGHSMPIRLPLSKQDERNLKRVRRKIKNKISAQESRRKKKDYLDALEKKMESYEQERVENKKRIESLENTQRSLHNHIRHLQIQIMNKVTGPGNTTSTGLMLFMVCFALLLVGGSMPSSYRQMNLPQTRLVSSSSLYYMGYGIPRNGFNNSQEKAALFPDRGNYKTNKLNSDFFEKSGIMPRQSILLGDDVDDQPHDDLMLSYVKSKRLCSHDDHNLISQDYTRLKNDSRVPDSISVLMLISTII